jgi:hypothetical protein
MLPGDVSQLAQEIARHLQGAGRNDLESFERRAQYGQLVFRAQIAAERTRCQCPACKLLREAVDVQVGPIETEGDRGGAGNSPQT